MFDTPFHYPRVIAKHRGGPSAEAREPFLEYRTSQGLATATLQREARELLVIAERIDITASTAIGLADIEVAAERWALEQQRGKRAHELRWSRALFVQAARAWLGFLERLEVRKPKTAPFADLLADFGAYGKDERGLSSVTIRDQSWHVEKIEKSPVCEASWGNPPSTQH